MLEALINGQTDAAELADLAKCKLRKKIPELEAAPNGRVRPHHRFMLREGLYNLES
jgi:transposase